MKCAKVLIDNSVFNDALIAQHGVEFADGEVLGKSYQYLRPLTRTRPRRSDWRQDEIDVLPRLAELIRKRAVEAFTTVELEAEAFRVRKYPPEKFTDLFEGCELGYLTPPLDRSKWGLDVEQHLSKEDVIQFCECFFIGPPASRVASFVSEMKRNQPGRLTPFEESCLGRLQTFKAICRGIAPTHYPDALHLWTAEENGMDAFLMHDKKFRNIVARQHVALHCKVMLPSEFLQNLVGPLSPGISRS